MKNNIVESLNELKTTDIYSLILFAIYKLKDVPEYSTISELVYLLDKDSLFNMLEYFGGMTIKIPTQYELRVVLNALIVYQLVNLEMKTIENAKYEINVPNSEWEDTNEAYMKIVEILSNYDFRRK